MPGRISELIYQIGTTIEIVRWIEVASPHDRSAVPFFFAGRRKLCSPTNQGRSMKKRSRCRRDADAGRRPAAVRPPLPPVNTLLIVI
ncbi:hypothetical protein A9K55_002532 [Cordyceps militaris]|uniref:Uncharacterized protein n=1 Tax=Cordyceps militaris TaxID=73501 RepID=A0A2H4S7Y2_CORMI|nr:hypothetical protein A9K55_002532 [Cordyceps militaris]